MTVRAVEMEYSMAMRSVMALWAVQLLVLYSAAILVSELSMLLAIITTVFVLVIVEMENMNQRSEKIVMMVIKEAVIVVVRLAKLKLYVHVLRYQAH